MPRIAVLMPVRNGERFVAQALRSVLAQQVSDLEVVVVDDGSDDGSRDEVLGAADDRVRIVDGPGHGVAAALQAGLEVIDSEFVCRMDADDLCLPGRLDAQVRHLEARPRCGLVGGQVRTISAAGNRLVTLNPELPMGADAASLHLAMANCFVHPAVMLRRVSVEEVGGYDTSVIFEDYDLWLRMARAWDVENVSHKVLAYRYHASNTYRLRRNAAVHQLAPRVQAYCHEVLGAPVEACSVEVLLNPAHDYGSQDMYARAGALEHLRSVLDRAATLTERRPLVRRARQLALQVVLPAWRRGRPLPPPAWAAIPRAAAAAMSRRVIP